MSFFDEQAEASLVKARIVSKYFSAWYKIILPWAQAASGKVAYIDLFAGPGRYDDGSISTPLMVLQEAISNPKLAGALVSIFNDGSPDNAGRLKKEIDALAGIDKLKYKPDVHCGEVDDKLVGELERISLVPTFSFIDPFGYKGLTMRAIKSVIKDWGCDCIFFFNYNRINAGISNPFVEQHMNSLFGEERANELRKKLASGKNAGMTPALREALILEELAEELKSWGAEYVLPFTFKNQRGTRTSHKLIFVTKHFRGYDVMKSIMASESSTDDEGVASFMYSPADASMPLLFSLNQPLTSLPGALAKTYKGKTFKMDDLYELDSVNKPFVRKHYTAALKDLEAKGLISAVSSKGVRRKGTYPSHVKFTFL